MRNGIAFPNTLACRRHLQIGILIGLFCYVALLGVIALTHDHEHCEHAHSEENCTACFYTSQHVGIEIEPVVLIYPFACTTTLPVYETVFLPLELPANTRSRAPPIFSTELANFAS